MNHSGLNIKDAMARLMGNKNLYLKLLDCFQKDYAQFDTQLVQLLEAGNYEEASIKVHSMKGMSGNLGAESLYEISRELEVLCKNKTALAELQPHLTAFSTEFQRVLRQIRDGVDLG